MFNVQSKTDRKKKNLLKDPRKKNAFNLGNGLFKSKHFSHAF